MLGLDLLVGTRQGPLCPVGPVPRPGVIQEVVPQIGAAVTTICSSAASYAIPKVLRPDGE
jgi:hypothetical protein